MAPRGIRNNNPGNIENGSFAKSLPGYAGSDGRFAIFATPSAGWNAIDALHQSYASRGLNTISGIITRWAPPKENDTGAYIASVSGHMGVAPNAPLDMQDPVTRQRLAQAQASVENGAKPIADYLTATGSAPIARQPPSPAVTYGQGETPALGTPAAPALPTPSQPVPSAPAAAPGGLGGLLARLVGAQPTLAPVAGVLGIPGQPPQGAPASPMGALSAYQPETPPPLQMPDFQQLQFAGQQPLRLQRPKVQFGRGFY